MNIDIKLDTVWKSNPETIKKFLDQRSDYEQLCAEIAYILKKRLTWKDIEISSVTSRAKTLKSFLEKITRKNYQSPFSEITDFAGVRVVYLYQSDLETIEEIINKEFSIIEKVDKLNEKGIDKFGYGAIHYLVNLGENSSGARYDDLKGLICEIQVRTVLQDAWAIIDHHLVYKRESDVPTNLQRKLNSLSGLFETADNQFEIIRQEREKYLSLLDKSSKSDDFLENEINLDTFVAYLKWKFPKLKAEYFQGQTNTVYNIISSLKFKNLGEIDLIVENNKKYLKKLEKYCIDNLGKDFFTGQELSSSIIVWLLCGIANKDYIDKIIFGSETKEAFKKFKKE